VAGGSLHGGQAGALVGFDVGAQPVAGARLGHGRHVVLEVGALDDEGGRLQSGEAHAGSLRSGIGAGSLDGHRYGAIMAGVDAPLATDRET
jgi:hypothetical protein